ncbi:hypothetical protein FF2_002279 [Malus domestica]
MSELPVASSFTSPIFLPHPAPPFVTYSDCISIPNSYATTFEQHSWVPNFDSLIASLATDNGFNIVRDVRHTSKQPFLKSGPVEKNLVVVSLVLMKRKPSSRSLCRRQYWNSLILSLVLTSLRPSTNSTTVVDNVKIEAHKQEEF